MPDINRWIAINPESLADCCAFEDEEEAFEHWCDFGDAYRYSFFNDFEDHAYPLNDDFEERAASDAISAAQMRAHERSYRRPA